MRTASHLRRRAGGGPHFNSCVRRISAAIMSSPTQATALPATALLVQSRPSRKSTIALNFNLNLPIVLIRGPVPAVPLLASPVCLISRCTRQVPLRTACPVESDAAAFVRCLLMAICRTEVPYPGCKPTSAMHCVPMAVAVDEQQL